MKGILGSAGSVLGCNQVKREKNIKGGIKMKKILKNQKGFSLVELLVALLIMAVIAAIAIGLLGGILDTTKASSDRETGKTIARAVQTYINATNDPNLYMMRAGGTISGNDVVNTLSQVITVSESGTSKVSAVTSSGGVVVGLPSSAASAQTITTPSSDAIQVATVGPLLDAKSVKPQSKSYAGWAITIDTSRLTVDCIPSTAAVNVSFK